MSIIYSTACLDCQMFAPEIGASGYIGFPSADTSRGPEQQPPNFGYLYQGFAGIQLITWHLDLLHEFFRTHAGHRIQTFADREPLLGNGGSGALAPDPADAALRPFGLQEAAWTEGAAATYPLARFRVHCEECKTEYLSSSSDNLRRFSPIMLRPDAIAQFRERMEGQLDSVAFMNAAPLDGGDVQYPDLQALLLFLAEHASHPATASISV